MTSEAIQPRPYWTLLLLAALLGCNVSRASQGAPYAELALREESQPDTDGTASG